jgi:peptidoglycan L-alanyl-D-glutamate endopeptidase CwlK
MTFQLGTRSLQRLSGVHPDLVRVVKRAIELTTVDFGVIEGLRTAERQAELFAQKATKTMNSRHMTGHAVDLAPFISGQPRWDWPLFYPLADAVKKVAIELKVPIVWGGAWDKQIAELGDMEKAVEGYVARRKKLGAKAFIDGPHFELCRKTYP